MTVRSKCLLCGPIMIFHAFTMQLWREANGRGVETVAVVCIHVHDWSCIGTKHSLMTKHISHDITWYRIDVTYHECSEVNRRLLTTQ